MINKFFFLVLAIFCLGNDARAKELSNLFEVNVPVDQYTNTNDGLNKAFNLLIKKLSGSRNTKYLWKIGDAELNKIDFVSSYSVQLLNEVDTLSVNFNRVTLIPELRKIGIPLIGFSRPVILFLIKVDAGEAAPAYMDLNNRADSLQNNIQIAMRKTALERGVYLELPEFDLEDQNFLRQTNILFSPSQYIKEKFYNDELLFLQISRVGINQWLINGDFNSDSTLQEDAVINFFIDQINIFLDDFLAIEPLKEGASGNKIILSINGLESYEDVQAVELELDKIFAIKTRAFHFFDRRRIEYNTQLFQTTNALLKELRGSSKLLVREISEDNQILYLDFLN